MHFDEMTNLINILGVVYIYIQVFGKMPQVLPMQGKPCIASQKFLTKRMAKIKWNKNISL